MRIARLLASVIPICIALPCGAAESVAFPTKPIRLIVPYPPSGSADIVARLLAEKLTERWNERIVIDNRGGASGIVGTELGAQAIPDGHTLTLAYIGTFVFHPAVYRKLPYDPLNGFAHVSLLTSLAYLLVVHPSSPATTVKALIALARERPDQLTYASSGSGSAPHLAGALFGSLAAIKLVHVPYKGGGPAMVDMLGGHVQLYFASSPNALPHVRANRLRLLAITSERRSQLAPDIPTVAESGLPGYETTSWYGLVAPLKTPRPIVEKLHAEVVRALALADLRERFAAQGVETVGNSPAEFRQAIRADMAKYGAIIKEVGLRAE